VEVERTKEGAATVGSGSGEEGMRVLVCGGRDFDDYGAVSSALDRIDMKHGIELVIDGAASGADELGHAWAVNCGKPSMRFPAHWGHGRKAGPLRNGWMLRFGCPDVVVAFSGGKGTANMISQARKAGVRVWEPAT
jgi:hypothetical protein